MVDVDRSFCIDRYEAHLVDRKSGEDLSPYYPPDPGRAKNLRAHWETQRRSSDITLGRAMPLPELPDWQLAGSSEPMAVATGQVVPSGYLDANTAERACLSAGKRLCTASEWVTACRGQQNRQFPYGNQYVPGACNVFREAHPAQLLHGNASEGHLDPRLNLTEGEGGPLLRTTGATTRCKSEWGNDAIYDMVGNLDEWVDDADGAFHGGFFARATKLGCDARISTHPRQYLDYSLGVRCCK
jgi:formylglycine-generating enzyme